MTSGIPNSSKALAAIALLVTSCTPGLQAPRGPLGSSSGGFVSDLTHQEAARYGSVLSQKDQQELDSYLAKAIEMKTDVESKAVALKTKYSSDPSVSFTAQTKYQAATRAMERLKASVQSDFVSNDGRTSQATERASKEFETAGNEFANYYASVNNEGRFGTVLLVVLDTINELWSLWTSYGEAQRQAYLAAVEKRLAPIPWAQL